MLATDQLATMKADIAANTATVPFGGQSVQIKDLPNTEDANLEIAKWYSSIGSDYWVWRDTVSRADIYHKTGTGGTTWNWATYKGQSVAEQNAWTQMFMGDQAPIEMFNFRAGVFAIFAGSTSQNDQRNHIFAAGKRLVNRAERLYVAQVAATGGGVVGPNNGNDTATARGLATNPDVLGFKGNLSSTDVQRARDST